MLLHLGQGKKYVLPLPAVGEDTVWTTQLRRLLEEWDYHFSVRKPWSSESWHTGPFLQTDESGSSAGNHSGGRESGPLSAPSIFNNDSARHLRHG